MTEFTLDTSGVVASECLAQTDPTQPCTCRQRGEIHWPDLSLFEQGYVEAMFASLREATNARLRKLANISGKSAQKSYMAALSRAIRHDAAAFSDFAPETLAAIRKDCAARRLELVPSMGSRRRNGADFWKQRQHTNTAFRRFPPLTVTLGDDGKVYARAAA